MMAVQWFIRGKDKVHGPFDAAKLRAFATAGKISRDTDVSQSTEGPWHKAGRVQGLFATAVMDAGLQPASPSAESSRQSDGAVGRQPPPPPVQRPAAISTKPPLPKDPGRVSLPSNPANKAADKLNTKNLWRKVVGALGSAIGVCVILYNVSVFAYSGYLQTDSAAISLIKKSLQETYEKSADVKKPVKVLEVQLEQGKGKQRTGRAVITFGGESVTLPFTAEVTKSFLKGVEVSWRASAGTPNTPPEQPQEPSTDTDSTTARSAPTAESQKSRGSLRRLDGKWILITRRRGDTEWKGEDEVVEFTSDKMLLSGKPHLKITASQWDTSPKQIDFEVSEGDRGPLPVHGVFELTGDTLTLCISPKRLSQMDEVNEDTNVLVMQRATPQSLAAASRGRAARSELKLIGLLYLSFENINKRFPLSWAEFRRLPDMDVDTANHLESGKYVLLYGPRLFAEFEKGFSKTVIGYSKDAPTAGGLVLFGDAHVERLSAGEFKSKPLASEIGSGRERGKADLPP